MSDIVLGLSILFHRICKRPGKHLFSRFCGGGHLGPESEKLEAGHSSNSGQLSPGCLVQILGCFCQEALHLCRFQSCSIGRSMWGEAGQRNPSQGISTTQIIPANRSRDVSHLEAWPKVQSLIHKHTHSC